MTKNPYDELGVTPDQSIADLKRRYRERLRDVHPDLNPDDPEADAKTQRLVAAYAFLSDPKKRAALDAQLRADAERQSPKEPTKRGPDPRANPWSRSTGHVKRQSGSGRARSDTRSSTKQSRQTQSKSQTVVTINGQRVNVSSGGSINIVVNGSRADGHPNQGGDQLGDVTVSSGSVANLVMGDLYVLSGSTVSILGQVMGDLFMASGCDVTVSGQIMGDVHAKGSDLVVLGAVMGDIFADRTGVKVRGVHMGNLHSE